MSGSEDGLEAIEPLLLLELSVHCPSCRMRQKKDESIKPITSTDPKEEHPNWTTEAIGIFQCEYCDKKYLITLPPAIKKLLPQRKQLIKRLRNQQ